MTKINNNKGDKYERESKNETALKKFIIFSTAKKKKKIAVIALAVINKNRIFLFFYYFLSEIKGNWLWIYWNLKWFRANDFYTITASKGIVSCPHIM